GIRTHAQSAGSDFLQIDRDGFIIVSTNLNFQTLVACQNIDTIELGLFRHTVDLVQTLSDFLLDGCLVGCRVCTIGSLDRQLANALQVVVDFVQGAFGRLRDGNPVVGVSGSLRQTLDVGGEAV